MFDIENHLSLKAAYCRSFKDSAHLFFSLKIDAQPGRDMIKTIIKTFTGLKSFKRIKAFGCRSTAYDG